MRRFLGWFLILLLVLAGAGVAGWWQRDRLQSLYVRYTATPNAAEPVPDPETYAVLIEDLGHHRTRLRKNYRNAPTAAERTAVLAETRLLLEGALPHLMRCWLGTPWDFNGMASKPGEGKVACGYFVSTVLQDAGFKVERIKLAQQPSQNILGTFLTDHDMRIRVGMAYGRYLAELRESGPGVYIVGLDSHVAFLVVQETGIRFIHSSGARPWCVVDEPSDRAGTLQASRYRVAGNLTANQSVLKGWLLETPFATRTR